MDGFPNGQPRINQGNQIYEFGCPAFQIGTTWIFFYFEHRNAFETTVVTLVRAKVVKNLQASLTYVHGSLQGGRQKNHAKI